MGLRVSLSTKQTKAMVCSCVLICFMSLSCTRAKENTFEKKLASAVERKKGTEERVTVDIASLTDFPWDRLFLFMPYTPLEAVTGALGFPWPAVEKTGIDRRDDLVLLVFVHGGKVVRAHAHPRNRGDFSGIRLDHGLTPSEAVFEVKEVDRGEPWLVLKLSEQAPQ